jgi:hypothetical protein
MEYFAAAWADEAYFTATFGREKLHMPMLVLGGEASFGPVSLMEELFGGASDNLVAEAIPKAGHWIGESSFPEPMDSLMRVLELTADIGDENPTWTGNRALRFFGDAEEIPSIDLSYLKDRVTLQGGVI